LLKALQYWKKERGSKGRLTSQGRHRQGKKCTEVNLLNEHMGVTWLYSFLSTDKKKTHCLYEVPSAEAIREAARLAHLPADVIIEVDAKILPNGTISAITA
jgi:hypothetical protein